VKGETPLFELDHLFVWAAEGAPEAGELIALGLTEGAPNTHPGQGTACRRFFFQNAYLELLWVCDPVEARQEAARRTGLWERWARHDAGASPFGVGLRPARPGEPTIPFQAWEYRPSYLPAPLAIHIGEDLRLSEPFWFFLDFGRRPEEPGSRPSQPLAHPAGLRELTCLRLSGPGLGNPSQVALAVMAVSTVTLDEGADHLAEITFDGGARGEKADLRPVLPLVFRW
jgi:hypothetical protein